MDPAVPTLSVPRRKEPSRDVRGSESETREPDSDRLSQPSVDSQPGLQKPDEEVVASPEMFASAPNALAFDETKLIDLPLAEQRRRGNELLSMLSEGDKAPCLPNLPPAPEFLRKSEGIYEALPGSAYEKKEWHSSGLMAGALRYIPPEQSTYQWDMASQSQWDKSQMVVPAQCYGSGAGGAGFVMDGSLNHELIPWLYEASHRAFGPGGTANVRCLPDASGYCAYEVIVQGDVAQAVEQGRDSCLIELLAHYLWPLLSDPYVDMQRGSDTATGGARITLWRSSEGDAADSQRCWQFARHNTCARGDACRWTHEVPETFGILIKVSSVRYAK